MMGSTIATRIPCEVNECHQARYGTRFYSRYQMQQRSRSEALDLILRIEWYYQDHEEFAKSESFASSTQNIQHNSMMMRQPMMTRESSWAMLDIALDDDTKAMPETTTVSKRVTKSKKTLPTLIEEPATTSMDDLSKIDGCFQQSSSQVTPTPSTSKTSRREQLARMSSWACLGMDDLWISNSNLIWMYIKCSLWNNNNLIWMF